MEISMTSHNKIKTVHELLVYIQQAKLRQDMTIWKFWQTMEQLFTISTCKVQHIDNYNMVHYTLLVITSKERLFTLCQGSCFS